MIDSAYIKEGKYVLDINKHYSYTKIWVSCLDLGHATFYSSEGLVITPSYILRTGNIGQEFRIWAQPKIVVELIS